MKKFLMAAAVAMAMLTKCLTLCEVRIQRIYGNDERHTRGHNNGRTSAAVLQFLVMAALILLPLAAFADSSGKCGDNVTWKYEEAKHTLTISGSGAMANYDYAHERAPWFVDYNNDIQKVVIEEGVTTIGVYAFDYCNAITSVTIPSSVTCIGEYNQEIKGETNVEIIPVST